MAKSIIKRDDDSTGHLSSISRKCSRCSSINFAHRNYSVYIKRVLREVAPQRDISACTVEVLNTMINDFFEQIVTKACYLMYLRNRCTLTVDDIQEAVYQLWPKNLAQCAVAFGNEAVRRFTHS